MNYKIDQVDTLLHNAHESQVHKHYQNLMRAVGVVFCAARKAAGSKTAWTMAEKVHYSIMFQIFRETTEGKLRREIHFQRMAEKIVGLALYLLC